MKLKPFKKRLGDGAWLGVPMDVYHAHRGISSTNIRDFLRSPLEYKRALDSSKGREATKSQDIGTCFHAAVLEDRNCFHIRPDELDGREWNGKRKDCQAWIEEHSDRPILSQKEAVELLQAAHYTRTHPKVASKRLLEGGHAEVSWIIEGEKARTDLIKIDGTSATVIDLKTATDASSEAFMREVLKWGYHIQAAWYRRVLRRFGLDLIAWYFIVVKSRGLPLLNVLELPKTAMDLGDLRIAEALLLLQQCEAANKWPDFIGDPNEPDRIQTVDLPAWCYGDAELEGVEEVAL